MKRFGIVSIALATLLFVGCSEKKEQHAAKNEASAVTKEMKQEVPKPEAKADQKPEHTAPKGDQAPAQSEPLPGVPAQAPKEEQNKTQTEVQNIQAAASSIAEAVKESAKEGMKEAEQKLHQAVAAATGATAAGAAAATKEEKTEATTKAAAADGAKLFAKCASCHGPKGERKALGKSGVIAGMAKEEVLKKLKEYQAGSLNLYGMGALMKGQVAGLNESDLEALADYISKLK